MRSAVRFAVIGTSGMFIQTWIFIAVLCMLEQPDKGSLLYYIAFGIGYVGEMIPNYLLSNWYTFGTRPNLKNAGGFVVARVLNMGIQLGLLPLALNLLHNWRDDYISYVVIFIGGCINYLICVVFFKPKKKPETAEE